jgi:hypothetical protein
MTEGSQLCLAGPALVKAAIGQTVDPEELGGASMHSQISGTVDFHEKDDTSCLVRLRSLIALLPERPPHSFEGTTERNQDDVYNIVQADGRGEYDVRDLLKCIVDAGSLQEFKSDFGRTVVTAYVRINDFDAEGMTTTGPGAAGAGGGLSRGGVIFEFNAADAASLKVEVQNFRCLGFERTFHFENVIASYLNLRVADVQNTAVLVHTYIATVTAQIEELTYSANPLVAFAVDSFFFQQVTAAIKNSTFYNPTKAWNGTSTNVPSGTNLTFENCSLYYNDARQQGKSCAVSFIDCQIYDYNDDASNSTMSVAYTRCQFRTTIGATYGNILSASSGAETFFLCDFTNQQPSVLKTVQIARYRDDSGIASSSCLRINNATTDMPRIRNAVYRVMEVDTGVTRLGYVTDTGSIYSPGAIPAIQAGSTATTVRCGALVTFSAFVEISQHPKL